MTHDIRSSGTELSTCTAKLLVLAYLFLPIAAWSLEAPSPTAGNAAAATAKRDSTRCVAQADVNACNDAIRRNPSDPALLVALGDALVRAKRPADAIRHYRRAATLAPHMPGLADKISATESRLASDRAPAVARASANPASGKRYSNAAPETQSH
jgi:cytochrome c-type biogenesis protein CcmH/NrfG